MTDIRLPTIDCEQVCNEIGAFVVEVVKKSGATGCVIGLSGGVDSSTTAAIIQTAFDRHVPKNGRALELIGYIIPSRINTRQDTLDAESVADQLGIRHATLNLEPIVDAFKATNPEALVHEYHRGNLISRIRANILSTKAASEHKVLAGTGNRDEDFGIGYYTLFGDGAVHVSPIAGMSKRLVREMALYLNLPSAIVQRTPTAGLEPGQSDFKDLGYDYDVVELVTEGLSQGFSPQQLKRHNKLSALLLSQFDAYAAQFGRSKFASVDAAIEDILKRHALAQRKMQIIHPPTPEITLNYS